MTRAHAPAFTVAFTKRSIDKSGKATLVAASQPGTRAVGMVYRIASADSEALDDAEGRSYERRECFPVICLSTGETIQACTYIARREQADLKPYDWYLALILAGLREHGLYEEYGAPFLDVLFDTDSDTYRETRREALKAFEKAKIGDYRALLRKS